MRKLFPALFVLALLAAAYLFLYRFPAQASARYGAPAQRLNLMQRIEYAARLYFYGDSLFVPPDPRGAERDFTVQAGESPASVARRLNQDGLIADPQAFLDYLAYSGLDVSLQAGEYRLSPALSAVEIARALQSAAPGQAVFVVLPGWRMEEIAASLPTSGLQISPEEFLQAASAPPSALDFLPAGASMEGFFLPYTYTLPRDIPAYQLLDLAARNFLQHITDEMKAGFEAQGLDLYRAVVLASLVERESIQVEEMPLIASVFLNRLRSGMNLASDPTVQYALGYDALRKTWWKNPLSLDDLKFDSPYNTYLYPGLPPAPIANPSLRALQAAAFPQESPYYFFQARCDGSGYHNFAATFEEHLANGCP